MDHEKIVRLKDEISRLKSLLRGEGDLTRALLSLVTHFGCVGAGGRSDPCALAAVDHAREVLGLKHLRPSHVTPEPIPQDVAEALDCIDRGEDEVGDHRRTVDEWRRNRGG